MSDTIAAVATGGELAAIGVLRLSGPRAIELVDRLFTPQAGLPMTERPDRALVYGALHDREGRLLDLCLCTVSRGPATATGEDTAELQCHGSPLLLSRVLEELFALGARQAAPGEFSKRAFLNGRLSLTAAEAVADLVQAESLEALHNAAGQLAGAVSRRADGVYDSLAAMSAHYHAVLDYPDEDVPDFQLEDYRMLLVTAQGQLRQLLDTYSRGRYLQSGIPTVIAGPPNAGKSSLLNALLGYDRAIVTARPGTTRDTIRERIVLGGRLLSLTDTAGLRDSRDPVERLGVERSRSAVREAELLLLVLDAAAPRGGEAEAELLAMAARSPKALVLLNKSDLAPSAPLPDTPLPTLRLSALTGAGLEELGQAVQALFPSASVPAGEVLANARQADAVSRALESLDEAERAMAEGFTPDVVLTEIEEAMAALGELSGRSVRADVTDAIFSRFCVGK